MRVERRRSLSDSDASENKVAPITGDADITAACVTPARPRKGKG